MNESFAEDTLPRQKREGGIVKAHKACLNIFVSTIIQKPQAPSPVYSPTYRVSNLYIGFQKTPIPPAPNSHVGDVCERDRRDITPTIKCM